MPRFSRDKGARGEREFLARCRRRLGLPALRRNLSQSQVSDGDAAIDLGGYVLEIKRAEKWEERWWEQACRQAEARSGAPALAWRSNGQRWLVMVRAGDLGLETLTGRLIMEADDWLARVAALERV